jgi:flagellar biosynthesis protein FliR
MIEAWVITFTAILLRLATFWMLVPLWTSVRPPQIVKLGLVFSLAGFWCAGLDAPAPLAAAVAKGQVHWIALAVLAVGEVLTGGLLALAFHVFFAPVQVAGSWLGQELGLNMAVLADPVSGENSNLLAKIFELAAILLFFMLDLHHFVFLCLQASLVHFPAASGGGLAMLRELMDGFVRIPEQGLLIAAPVAMVTLIALTALLALARAVPALNLFTVGMPFRLLVGLVAIVIFLPVLVDAIRNQFDSGVDVTVRMLVSR